MKVKYSTYSTLHTILSSERREASWIINLTQSIILNKTAIPRDFPLPSWVSGGQISVELSIPGDLFEAGEGTQGVLP